MGRNEEFIETGRAVLFMDVTVHEQPAEGSIEITVATNGSITSILIGGVTELIGTPVPFNTSIAQTALDVAAEINGRITAPQYHARAVDAFVFVWQQTIVGGTITLVSTAGGDFAITDTDLTGGVIGDGTPLGLTEEGFTLSYNDEYLREAAEESGVRVVKTFFLGENTQLDAVFKQWDEDTLALRLPNRHTTAGSVNRVEIGGNQAGSDHESFFKVMEVRPENKKYATILIRKGQVFGNAGEPTRFRTQEIKKIGVAINCDKDFNHVATNYPTLGIDLAQNLVL